MIYHYLRNLKKAKNMSNQDLSDISGIPVGTINRILSGQTDNPSFETICELVKAMDGSVDEAIGIVHKHNNHSVELYERTIKEKNKWIKTLFIVSCTLVGALLAILFIDILNPNVGWFRY